MNEIGVLGRERKSCRKRRDRNCLPTDANLFGYICQAEEDTIQESKTLTTFGIYFCLSRKQRCSLQFGMTLLPNYNKEWIPLGKKKRILMLTLENLMFYAVFHSTLVFRASSTVVQVSIDTTHNRVRQWNYNQMLRVIVWASQSNEMFPRLPFFLATNIKF